MTLAGLLTKTDIIVIMEVLFDLNLYLDLSDVLMESSEPTLHVSLDVSQDPGPHVNLDFKTIKSSPTRPRPVPMTRSMNMRSDDVDRLVESGQTNVVCPIVVSGRKSATLVDFILLKHLNWQRF